MSWPGMLRTNFTPTWMVLVTNEIVPPEEDEGVGSDVPGGCTDETAAAAVGACRVRRLSTARLYGRSEEGKVGWMMRLFGEGDLNAFVRSRSEDEFVKSPKGEDEAKRVSASSTSVSARCKGISVKSRGSANADDERGMRGGGNAARGLPVVGECCESKGDETF